MNMWKYLVETALPGTEKKPLEIDLLPEAIKESMLTLPSNDPEVQLLTTLSLSYYYNLVGKTAPLFTGEINDSIIEEELEIAPKPLQDIFSALENVDFYLKETLCNTWLDLLINKKFIVLPEVAVELLYMGNQFSEKSRKKILEVVGNKVRWSLSVNSELNYKKNLNTLAVWSEGNMNERKGYFASQRSINPYGALEMLKNTWDNEPILSKRGFLEIIKESFAASDLSFVEDLYKNEFVFKPKEKKTEKECRKIIAEILLAFRESELHQVTLQSLSKYTVKNKKKGLLGFLGGKEEIEFVLPETEDDFWNTSYMEKTYGLEVQSYDIALYKTIQQYWLSIFLESIPLLAWSETFSCTHQVLLDYFVNQFTTKINGKDRSIYLNSFIANATNFKDKETVIWLVDHLSANDALPLLKHLNTSDFDQYVKKNKYYLDSEILKNGPFQNTGESWSETFSESIIAEVYQAFQKGTNSYAYEWGKVMAKYAHVNILSGLMQYNQRMQGNNNFNLWTKAIFDPVIAAIEIRKTIASYKF